MNDPIKQLRAIESNTKEWRGPTAFQERDTLRDPVLLAAALHMARKLTEEGWSPFVSEAKMIEAILHRIKE